MRCRRHGQAAFRGSQFQQIVPKKFRYGYDDKVNGDLCGEQGWYGEETLDVEAVHAMAPGANVLYLAGRSCDDPDLLKALDTIVQHRRADIITNSWGDIGEDVPPDTLRAYTATFVQAALEGIGVFYSSGDDGDDSGDTEDGSAVVDFPSSHPLVTSVGGTSLGVGQDNGYLFETRWATGKSVLSANGTAWDPPLPGKFLYGGGGGTSALWPEPFYQAPRSRPRWPGATARCPTSRWTAIRRPACWSARPRRSPTARSSTRSTRSAGRACPRRSTPASRRWPTRPPDPHGFANPAIYALNGRLVLHDVAPPNTHPAVVRLDYDNGVDGTTSATLRSLDDEAQSLHLASGWDNLTGVGTPNGPGYVGSLGARGR